MAKRKLKTKAKAKPKPSKPRAKPTPRKSTVAEAIAEACSELTTLGGEMREWADNLEDKFSSTQKYSDVSEAADALENFTEPSTELPAIADLEVSWIDPIPRHLKSRASRRDHMVYILDQCVEALEVYMSDGPELQDEAESLKSDIETVKDEVEYVEFPGMFG